MGEDGFGTGRSVVPLSCSNCPVVPSHVVLVVPLSRYPVGGRSCSRVPLHGSQRAAAIGEPLHVAGISGVSMWDSTCR